MLYEGDRGCGQLSLSVSLCPNYLYTVTRMNIIQYQNDDYSLAKFGDRSTIIDSGPDVEAPLAVMASSRNPLTINGSQPEYTKATMRRAWTTVQMVVDIFRTQVRLYRPVAMSESMAYDRHSENRKRVKCGMPDQRPICGEKSMTIIITRLGTLVIFFNSVIKS